MDRASDARRPPGLPGLLLVLLASAASVRAQPALPRFDRIVSVLRDRFVDRGFVRRSLPGLEAQYRALLAATEPGGEHPLLHAFLAEFGRSHLALFSAATYGHLMRELRGRDRVTFGLQLLRRGDGLFAHAVLEGGPAERAGVRNGDRVLRIDGVAAAESPLLDWRADDAALPDRPLHELRALSGGEVELWVERVPGERRSVIVAARRYSAYRASRASLGTLEHHGRRIAYLHLHYMYSRGMARLLRALRAEAGGCDGLVLDLRGRGGSAAAVDVVLRMLAASPVPVVVLVDERTRSAKEIVAHEVQRRGLGVVVGGRTAGAVLPASFVRIDEGAVLMLPEEELGDYSVAIEGVGVAPDVAVEAAGAYAAGRDPILSAGCQVLVELATAR